MNNYYTVWAGGVEVTDYYVLWDTALKIKDDYLNDGYDDVIIERVIL